MVQHEISGDFVGMVMATLRWNDSYGKSQGKEGADAIMSMVAQGGAANRLIFRVTRGGRPPLGV